jgi:oligopeptide transport system substrate-binding protein
MKKLAYILLSALLISGLLVATSCQPGATGTNNPSENALHLYNIDPLTLDPAIAGDATSNEYILQIFSGLVRLDENLQPAPDIANGWDIDPDGKTYTFYLSTLAHFHDGRLVTAQDFKYSWERALSPATGSQTAATYLGDIVGASEVLAGTSKELSGIEVIDDHTLKVTIDEPKSYFLDKLTYVASLVVDSANVAQGYEWWRQPNGTGPFKLKKWQQNQELVLERSDFHDPTSSFLSVEQIVFHLWAGVPINLYETGQIDIAHVDLSNIEKVTDTRGEFHQELSIIPELNINYIGFNHQKPPFDDLNIRRAFTQAIDREKLVSLVFKDMLTAAYGILPPAIPGFNEDLSGLAFDATAAKELIIASSYGDAANLPPISITISGWGGLIPQDLAAIIHMWKTNLGVEVSVRQLEPEEYIYNLKQEKDEMFYWGWSADYPHPQNFLEILFATGSEANPGGYSNPEVDNLLDMAAREQDEDFSLNLYRQVEQLLVTDAACLPLWFGQSYLLVKPYVTGYRLNPLGYAVLNTVSVLPH